MRFYPKPAVILAANAGLLIWLVVLVSSPSAQISKPQKGNGMAKSAPVSPARQVQGEARPNKAQYPRPVVVQDASSQNAKDAMLLRPDLRDAALGSFALSVDEGYGSLLADLAEYGMDPSVIRELLAEWLADRYVERGRAQAAGLAGAEMESYMRDTTADSVARLRNALGDYATLFDHYEETYNHRGHLQPLVKLLAGTPHSLTREQTSRLVEGWWASAQQSGGNPYILNDAVVQYASEFLSTEQMAALRQFQARTRTMQAHMEKVRIQKP